jgi:hypothetical protein
MEMLLCMCDRKVVVYSTSALFNSTVSADQLAIS